MSSPHVQNSVKSLKSNRDHRCVSLVLELKDPSRGLLNAVASVIKEQHLGSIIDAKRERASKRVIIVTKLRSNTSQRVLDDKVNRLCDRLVPVINLTVHDYRETAHHLGEPDDDTPQNRATSKRRDRHTRRRRRFAASQAHRPALVTS